MAVSRATSDLFSRIKSALPDLAVRLERDYREDLDAKVSILDLSYQALLVNVYRGRKLSKNELAAYDNIYETLIEVVSSACARKTFTSLDDPKFLPLFNSAKSPGAILINGGRDNIFLVSKNFDTTRKFVTTYISRNPKLKASRFGEKSIFEPVMNQAGKATGDYTKKTRSKVDIGHIPTEDSEALSSPLELKLQSVLDYGIAAGSSRIQSIAQSALKDLYSIQADISYNFKNTAPEAIAAAQRVLGKGYLVLTLHTEKKNNQFAVLEKQVYDKLIAELALSVQFETVSGSNTIIEDIAENLFNILDGNRKKLKSHKAQEKTVKQKLKSNLSVKTSTVALPTIRTTRAASTTNIVQLQNLINQNLAKQIQSNMGTGSSTKVLNYRTGRLAESAKVEKMSESRQGMITAFYSYMRNPYGTFAEGGAQEFPVSRNPKTLIAQSIRQLAGAQVANRMRAVLV